MDFQIDILAGQPGMTWTKATDIRNNVILSLLIRRGDWWFNPNFGMRPLPKKNTARAEALVESYALEALQWLLDTGRARKIEVQAERDRTRDLNRMRLSLAVTQADGSLVEFEHFVEVV
jgi:phage gp46-like protein